MYREETLGHKPTRRSPLSVQLAEVSVKKRSLAVVGFTRRMI